MKKHIIAVVIVLVMIAALSVTAFADGPQMGEQAPQMSGQSPQMGRQSPQMGEQAPQMGEQAPQMGGQAPQMGGQNPQMGERRQMKGRNGFDQQTAPDENGQASIPADDGQMRGHNGFGRGNRQPLAMDQFMNGIEDEEIKANLEGLMQSYLDALDAERNAEDEDARTEASEAVTAAKDALDEAFAEAGIELSVPDSHRGHGKQQTEASDQAEPPADEQPPEMPGNMSEDEMFQLFQQFMDWMKNQE